MAELTCVLDTLDDLLEEDLERFVFHLARNPPEGLQCIPRAKVYKKSREVVVDEMIEKYGEHRTLLVTVDILKIIKKNNLASKLKKQISVNTNSNKRTRSDSNVVPVKKQRQTKQPDEVENTDEEPDFQSVMTGHKLWLKRKNHFIVEETAKNKNKIALNDIYTDLIITKGESAYSQEHEVLPTESLQFSCEAGINCNNIFDQEEEEIKTVLTKGVAGVGKTVSVQKFILDWAENKANQDVAFVFVLPFRQLNLFEPDARYSLHELLVCLHPELKGCHSSIYIDQKILFIFDGLEESRMQMNFRQFLPVHDVHSKSTVAALIINLITRDLLSSALIWITSRPAAANQIPAKYIDRVTEIQGFSDSQKEQYFRKRLSDKAEKIISHIKRARSLYIMCHIPVFCWISVTALQPWLTRKCRGEIPTTLTEMYSHFLLVQMNRKNEKFDERPEIDARSLLESNKSMILKLAELAFKQLLKGNMLFSESDLTELGIDVQESFLYSGLCTEFFKMESDFYRTKVYCFVHLSFQEFFAAIYVFNCYLYNNKEEVKMFLPKAGRSNVTSEISLDVLMKNAVNEALKSTNGHLDLFLRFLHGMSLESNQRLLQGILPGTRSSSESVGKIKRNLKRGQKRNINPERWLNLSHCLIEMKDDTLQKEILTYLESGKKSKKLTLAQCSAMANMFQVSEEVMDELDLKKYNTTEEGRRRLIPALRNCRKGILADCNLTNTSCENIASALQSVNSPLRELDLSNNDLPDAGLKLLCEGLKCKLEILRIADCKLTEESCSYIGKALAHSRLRELDLSRNDLQDTGMKQLCVALRRSRCRLNVLKLVDCKLTTSSCPDVALVLQKANSSLRELDLSDNDLLDCGVKELSTGLKSSQCVLEILRLSGCRLTAKSCFSLILAVHSNPKHLTELDLSYNHVERSAWKRLLFIRKSLVYKLETIRTGQNDVLRMTPGLRKYAYKLTLEPNTAHADLSLTADNTRMSLLTEDQPCLDHRLEYVKQALCSESLSGRCYWEVEWGGWASIAVAYKSIRKRGHRKDCRFGYSKKSWSLEIEDSFGHYTVVHNSKRIAGELSRGNRVGVYVDFPAGILSFYTLSSDTHTLTCIHTFHATFTEPLFAGFGLKDVNSSISIIHF